MSIYFDWPVEPGVQDAANRIAATRKPHWTALLNLLSPVQKAAEKSGSVRELVDSSRIFKPLPSTPAEAYRFLKDVPAGEAADVSRRTCCPSTDSEPATTPAGRCDAGAPRRASDVPPSRVIQHRFACACLSLCSLVPCG